MNSLQFRRLPIPADGMVAYGAIKQGVSFVISFDPANPEYGFIASYQRIGCDTVYLDGSFESVEQARDALMTAHERSKQ